MIGLALDPLGERLSLGPRGRSRLSRNSVLPLACLAWWLGVGMPRENIKVVGVLITFSYFDPSVPFFCSPAVSKLSQTIGHGNSLVSTISLP